MLEGVLLLGMAGAAFILVMLILALGRLSWGLGLEDPAGSLNVQA